MAVMPLSSSRNPTTCDRARRRVARAKNPIRTTATATGRIAVAGDGRQRDQRAGDRVGQQGQRGGGQQRGGDVDRRAGLALLGSAAPPSARRASSGSTPARRTPSTDGDRDQLDAALVQAEDGHDRGQRHALHREQPDHRGELRGATASPTAASRNTPAARSSSCT